MELLNKLRRLKHTTLRPAAGLAAGLAALAIKGVKRSFWGVVLEECSSILSTGSSRALSWASQARGRNQRAQVSCQNLAEPASPNAGSGWVWLVHVAQLALQVPDPGCLALGIISTSCEQLSPASQAFVHREPKCSTPSWSPLSPPRLARFRPPPLPPAPHSTSRASQVPSPSQSALLEKSRVFPTGSQA